MAERINWNAYRNQVVRGWSPYTVRGVDLSQAPEAAKNLLNNVGNHPFVNKVRNVSIVQNAPGFIGRAAKSWWENVDPRQWKNKDTAWKVGAAIGAVESFAVLVLAPIPGVSGIVKGIANTAVMQGFLWGAHRIHEGRKANIQSTFAGSPLLQFYLDQLDADHTSRIARTESVFIGISAGATYFGLGLGVERIGEKFVENFFQASVRTAEATATPASALIPTEVAKAPTAMPTGTPTTTPTETPRPTMTPRPTFTPTSVPTETPRVPTTVPTVVEAPAKVPTSTPGIGAGETLVAPKPAAPTVPAPATAPAPAEAIVRPPIVTEPRPAVPAVEPAPKAPAVPVDPSAPTAAAEAARAAAEAKSMPFHEKLAKFMAENKDLVVDHTVAQGETAGHLVLQMDGNVTWDGTDWQGFAILSEMNPDAFKDIQTILGLNDTEFDELVKRMQKGDKAAYDKLIKHMSLIKAGDSVKLLTAAGLQKFLNS